MDGLPTDIEDTDITPFSFTFGTKMFRLLYIKTLSTLLESKEIIFYLRIYDPKVLKTLRKVTIAYVFSVYVCLLLLPLDKVLKMKERVTLSEI